MWGPGGGWPVACCAAGAAAALCGPVRASKWVDGWVGGPIFRVSHGLRPLEVDCRMGDGEGPARENVVPVRKCCGQAL